jgi:hypothetical protein
MARGEIIIVWFIGALAAGGCGSGSEVTRREWMRELKKAMASEVTTRDVNHDNSRTLQDALDEGVLKNMQRHEVRDAIGRGVACATYERCASLGFRDDDWLYTVGRGDEKKVGKLPIFIVGFGIHGRVVRTWNLRVH